MIGATGKVVNVAGGGYCGAAGPYGLNTNPYTLNTPSGVQPAIRLWYVGPQPCQP